MKRDLNEYGKLMHQVYAPQELKQRVLRAADREREKQKPSVPVRWKKAAMRTSAVCCALALVAGGFVFSGGQHSAVPTSAGSAQSASSAAAPKNTFDLAVYAAGVKREKKSTGSSASGQNPQAQNTTVRLLDFGWSYRSGNGPTAPYDAKTQDCRLENYEFDKAYNEFQYGLNVACTGKNIKSIQYSFDNSGLAKGQSVDFDIWKTGADGSESETFSPSFTVSYSVQNSKSLDRSIRIKMPIPAEEAKAWIQSYDFHEPIKTEAEKKQYEAQFEPRIDAYEYQLAQVLAQSRLVMTATFTDGTKQTKKYRIAPVSREAFLQRREQDRKICDQWSKECDKYPCDKSGHRTPENQAAYDKMAKKYSTERQAYTAAHPLFMLTQVSG